MLIRFTSSLNTSEQNSVRTRRCPESELIKGNNFTTGLKNTLLSCTSESKSGNGELGNFRNTDVIGDRTDLNNDFGITVRGFRGLLDDARKGERRAIDLGEEKTVQYDLKKFA